MLFSVLAQSLFLDSNESLNIIKAKFLNELSPWFSSWSIDIIYIEINTAVWHGSFLEKLWEIKKEDQFKLLFTSSLKK